jgi:N utilization substance protein B
MVAVNMIYAVTMNDIDIHDYWTNLTQYVKTHEKQEQKSEEEDYYLDYLQKIVEAGKESEVYLLLRDLYLETLKHRDENIELITNFLENWDWSRINKVEQILMMLCITEWLYFPGIPAKVSLNEYMEIAKIYANPDESHKFINGILDKILVYLRENKKILK